MDLYHNWGGDLSLGPTNDLATVDNTQRGRQRVLRRLLTNSGDYIFHTEYGAGLPGRVGQNLNPLLLQSIVKSQIFREAAVSKDPAPVISTKPILNGVQVYIGYTDETSGQQQALAFDVSET